MSYKKEAHLISLFNSWSSKYANNIILLPESGSYREYYRIESDSHSAVGVLNNDKKENTAFIGLTKHFIKAGLSVPKVYKEDLSNNAYLIEDLGDTSLFSYISSIKNTENHLQKTIAIYKLIIDELTKFQILANKNLDYSICYPRPAFDKQSMMWDLNYFKYYFLKLAKVPFDEQNLEDDFNNFSDYLLECDSNFFLYRDFQSANIMLYNNKPYFIDYQGGRRGALQYDIASLLFDSKANIPHNIRDILLNYYIDVIRELYPINVDRFIHFFYGFVLIRIMQAMGAYGFRGLYEKKKHFLYSIPYAIGHLKSVLEIIDLSVFNNGCKTLINTLSLLVEADHIRRLTAE